MLQIDYKKITYSDFDKVHISYDADTDNLLFDYTYHNQHLENYDYDYERIKTIITKKNIEQFFKVRTFKAPEGMFVNTEGYLDIEVSYNDKKRILNFENRGERIYTKRPVILIEKITEYVEKLNCAIRKQIDRMYELEEMGIRLPGNPTAEELEEYRTGLMWESLSYSTSKPTEQERRVAAEKFKVSLEACERWKFTWWKRLIQHHSIKWLC